MTRVQFELALSGATFICLVFENKEKQNKQKGRR